MFGVVGYHAKTEQPAMASEFPVHSIQTPFRQPFVRKTDRIADRRAQKSACNCFQPCPFHAVESSDGSEAVSVQGSTPFLPESRRRYYRHDSSPIFPVILFISRVSATTTKTGENTAGDVSYSEV
jgi:hypothetical protein